MKTPTSSPTELFHRLTSAAPQIALQVKWEHDPDERWNDPINRDWTKGLDPDDWQAWQSEVTATAIDRGQMISGSAYLGGTWEKFGEHPSKSNPDISGYLPQMLEESLTELAAACPAVAAQVQAALQTIRKD